MRTFFILVTLLLTLGVQGGTKKNQKTYKIRDKIFLITHPLMKKATRQGDTVTFIWSEPHHDFKYFLEVYREGNKKPISTMSVSGGEKLVKFKKKERKHLFWRVIAQSSYGNRMSNKKAMLIPLNYD